MRRLGKEAYLINYNNDVHNPQGRANQKDIAMRMQQFFDAKLKGRAAAGVDGQGHPGEGQGEGPGEEGHSALTWLCQLEGRGSDLPSANPRSMHSSPRAPYCRTVSPL